MSRIGKKPIPIPAEVEVTVSDALISFKGPKGTLQLRLTGAVEAQVDAKAKEVRVICGSTLRVDRAKHGLYRALLANMIVGVTKGYEKRLEIQGVGYRAILNGKRLQLFVGYNTKVPELFHIPDGITTVRIDPETGKRAKPGQPNAIFEYFREENVPAQEVDDDMVNPHTDGGTLPEQLF